MAGLRLLLVEDQTIVRQALRTLLETDPDLRVVGEAGSVADAIAEYRRCRPDVVLMDLRLGEQSGLDATRAILAEDEGARVLALTAFEDFQSIEAAVSAGLLGYVPKQTIFSQLVEAIRSVAAGRRYVHPVLTENLLEGIRHQAFRRDQPQSPLTQEEQRLMRQMADGLSFAEIAAQVFLSERTVRRHVQALLDKLGAADRVQAVAMALRNGWLN